MAKKHLTVKDLVAHFPSFEQITGDENALKRELEVLEVNRPGFELVGFFNQTDFRRIFLFGSKEMAFIQEMNEEQQRLRFNEIIDGHVPMIVISKGNPCPEILRVIAQTKNCPIFLTPQATGRISFEMSSILERSMAPETLMHGVFMSIYGKGVLITGESGIGKSEIALELIKRGHQLVADDAIELCHVGQEIEGKSPDVLSNLLEIRGIGVIDIVKMFGVGAILDKLSVELIIQLERWVPSREYTRIGFEDNNVTQDILGVSIPKVVVPVMGGRSMSAVIEAAVMNTRLKDLGFDSNKEFVDRILKNIDKNKGGRAS